MINFSKEDMQKKLNSMRDFIISQDKKKTGLMPVQNFLKIVRIFGLQLSNNQLALTKNEDARSGFVDYDKVLKEISF